MISSSDFLNFPAVCTMLPMQAISDLSSADRNCAKTFSVKAELEKRINDCLPTSIKEIHRNAHQLILNKPSSPDATLFQTAVRNKTFLDLEAQGVLDKLNLPKHAIGDHLSHIIKAYEKTTSAYQKTPESMPNA